MPTHKCMHTNFRLSLGSLRLHIQKGRTNKVHDATPHLRFMKLIVAVVIYGRKAFCESLWDIYQTRLDVCFHRTVLDTPGKVTGEVVNTGDLCLAYWCGIMAGTKWNTGTCNKDSQTSDVESEKIKGLQTVEGKKEASSYRRSAGSPNKFFFFFFDTEWGHTDGFLSHLTGIQNGRWLQRLSCRFCQRFLQFALRRSCKQTGQRGLPVTHQGGKVKIQSDLLLPVSQKPRGEV